MEQPQEVEDEEHERVYQRVAAVDVAKASGVVCTRVPDEDRPGRRMMHVWTVGATMNAVTELGDHLRCEGIEVVTVESTGEYWRVWHAVLEAAGLTVQLVNARSVKNVPGRAKTDKKDAVWLAKLTERGMLQPSFVPPYDIRRLREYTRLRADLVHDRTRQWARLEKLLERALIKVSAVASTLDTQSVRAMLEALIAGQRDPDVLADLARRRLRARIPELARALEGRFSEHHGFLARVHLDLIDQHTAAIGELTRRIEQVIEPFRGFRDLICSIPGIAAVTADVIVAEIGDDMSRFPTAGHLASWAGTVPGSNESAGKVKSSSTPPGNRYLQGALGTAAMSCAQHPGTYLNAKYRRVATRRGPQKANVAIQHAILVAIWNMGTNGTFYEDPGGDYFTRLNPERARTRAIRQLESLGYTVALASAS